MNRRRLLKKQNTVEIDKDYIESIQNSFTVGLDKLILVAKIKHSEMLQVYKKFPFKDTLNKFKDVYFEKSRFTILLDVRNNYTRKHYNSMIVIHNKNAIKTLPDELKEIIQMYDWKVKRIDIAFDVEAQEFKDHFILLNHSNTKTYTDLEWKTSYYYGGKHAVCMMNCYDRNVKVGKPIHDKNLRIEIRIRPKLKDSILINNIDHDYLIRLIGKYTYIHEIDKLQLQNGWNKTALRKISDNINTYKERWRSLDSKRQKEIKKACNSLRIPLEEVYKTNIDNLFSWIKEPSEQELEELLA